MAKTPCSTDAIAAECRPVPMLVIGVAVSMVPEVHEMRIYQRGVDESLMIGEDVVVTVVEVLPDGVRLGISDPRSFPSYWEETVFLEEQPASSNSVFAHAYQS